MAKAARKPVKGKAAQQRVSKKISKMAEHHPEMVPKQRVAVALNAEREHRLGPGGEYKPVKKQGKSKKGRR